ncbi:MAG: hypothetical protein FLDDKLPJ_01097 [Phycisphaerae bacterium]|nr:hypothetical protein [Phycisphaerae bacterium]
MRTNLIHVGCRAAEVVLLCAIVAAPGCERSTTKVELQKQVDALQVENKALKREAEKHRADIERLESQVANLQTFSDPAGAKMFAPVRLEILSLSRGADYDGAPGDDGVTVHFRPLDAEGNVVTVGGRISVQVVDNSVMGEPRVVALVELSDPKEVKEAWHSKFLTNQYTVKCRFPQDQPRPVARRLDVKVAFVDYLTGNPLQASRTVDFTPDPGAESSEARSSETLAKDDERPKSPVSADPP